VGAEQAPDDNVESARGGLEPMTSSPSGVNPVF
jgi:hypothetical protein